MICRNFTCPLRPRKEACLAATGHPLETYDNGAPQLRWSFRNVSVACRTWRGALLLWEDSGFFSTRGYDPIVLKKVNYNKKIVGGFWLAWELCLQQNSFTKIRFTLVVLFGLDFQFLWLSDQAWWKKCKSEFGKCFFLIKLVLRKEAGE